MNDMATTSYQTYVDFKNHPQFLPYLEKMSTLKYYAKTNIGSRPSKRATSDTLDFSALRAIPFVGSWSQLKQNVPGFFGVGTALKKYEDANRFDEVIEFYNSSDFFKTLLENSMMSLTKSFFGLTSYMAEDPEFGEFWKLIHTEYQTTKRLLLKLTGHTAFDRFLSFYIRKIKFWKIDIFIKFGSCVYDCRVNFLIAIKMMDHFQNIVNS